MLAHKLKKWHFRGKFEINHELLSLLERTKANKITANPKKYSALTLTPKITNPIQTIEKLFNKNPLSVDKSVKYKVITIDEKLNFAEHIITLTCKISRSVRILSKLRNILPFTALRKLYYSMIHSHSLYGIVTGA